MWCHMSATTYKKFGGVFFPIAEKIGIEQSLTSQILGNNVHKCVQNVHSVYYPCSLVRFRISIQIGPDIQKIYIVSVKLTCNEIL